MGDEPIESLPIQLTAEQAETIIKVLVARLHGAVQISEGEWKMAQKHALMEEQGLLVVKQVDWEE